MSEILDLSKLQHMILDIFSNSRKGNLICTNRKPLKAGHSEVMNMGTKHI